MIKHLAVDEGRPLCDVVESLLLKGLEEIEALGEAQEHSEDVTDAHHS